MSVNNIRPAHLELGERTEELARRYLRERQYAILGRNWTRPWGELDIVARKNGVVHFVEVKGERADHAGFEAFRRANARKLEKVRRTARTWLASNGLSANSPWQIDVISVTVDEDAGQARITHFKNVPF